MRKEGAVNRPQTNLVDSVMLAWEQPPGIHGKPATGTSEQEILSLLRP